MTRTSGSWPVPGSPQKRLSPAAARLAARARNEWNRRQWGAAERSLTAVLALAPDDPDALRMLGLVVQRRGDFKTAIDCFQRVVPVWPEDRDLRIWLGIALCETGNVDDAIVHFRRACELAPAAVLSWFNLGKALERGSCWEEAAAALSQALALDPSHVSSRLLLAKAQATLGQVDAAVAGFREAIRREPGNAEAWFGLSSLNTVRFDAADVACLERTLLRKDLSSRQYELLNFTFAKALEGQGDYARAFEAFGLANMSRRQRSAKWDAAAERKRVEAIQTVFADAVVPPPVDAGFGHEVVLIVSMPRSGSTLVEQILASHPEVEAANEIEDMTRVIDAETRRRHAAFPSWAPAATGADWQRLGRGYLARTARWRAIKSRFTDKSLVNWRLVGAALAMLPAAHVVIVRRDPVETCLGCYRQSFSEARGFACDLDDTADYCIDFLQLTRFWLKTYPSRVLDVQYETLVADPDSMVRRLLDFCDLSFDPACLEFYSTSRAVLTGPSAAQVRQPLRRDTARAARYGDKLDRLRQRLRRADVLAD